VKGATVVDAIVMGFGGSTIKKTNQRWLLPHGALLQNDDQTIHVMVAPEAVTLVVAGEASATYHLERCGLPLWLPLQEPTSSGFFLRVTLLSPTSRTRRIEP